MENTEETFEMTLGNKLVGRNFNPGQRTDVDEAKELAAKLIDKVQQRHNTITANGAAMASHERNTLRTAAITKLVEAQMWAVKYLTWED